MSKPWIKVPSLGTLHPLGYGVLLACMLIGGVNLTLNAVFLITMAVPAVGAFEREPKAPWRAAALACILLALGFLISRQLQQDAQPYFFYMGEGPYGMMAPKFDPLNLLVVGAIFLPLSAACAIDRVIRARKLRQVAGS